MTQLRLIAAAFSTAALCAFSSQPAHAAGIEKLYILNCGEGIAGDISRWSPGVNEGKSMPFVDNCYLIKHAQGWMLWDTGLKVGSQGNRELIDHPAAPAKTRRAELAG